MTTRNFKVRIHNVNLKKVFFLESATDQYALRVKYTKYLTSLGYDFIRSYATSKRIKSYHFYPTDLFKTRAAYHKVQPGMMFRPRRVIPVNTKPILINPYMVLLEIIELNTKHNPNL